MSLVTLFISDPIDYMTLRLTLIEGLVHALPVSYTLMPLSTFILHFHYFHETSQLVHEVSRSLGRPTGVHCENTVQGLEDLIRRDNAGQLPEGALAYVEYDVHVSFRAASFFLSWIDAMCMQIICAVSLKSLCYLDFSCSLGSSVFASEHFFLRIWQRVLPIFRSCQSQCFTRRL